MTARTFPLWLALVFAIVCGAGIALQSRINGELGHRLGDGFTAAAISFGSGLIILIVTLFFFPNGIAGLFGSRRAPGLREERGEKTDA